MDELDVRIVRAMGTRPYERRPKDPEALKPARIAEALGTSVNTIKARIARMEEAGVIAGYKLWPNLRHLGLAGEAYYFRSPLDEEKEAALKEIATLQGLIEVHDFLGRGFCVDFTHDRPADLDGKLGALSKSTGDQRPLKFYEREMPPVERRLTQLDWRILRALRWNATRPLDDVADDVGVTGRTVRSRYARMAQEGSFFSVPMFDASKAEGLFLFEMLFHLDPAAFQETTRAILKEYNGSHVYAYVPSSPQLGHFDVLLFARSTAQVDELRQRGAAIPGVERAEAWLFRGLHDHSRWLDDAIDERIRAASA